MDIDPEHQLTTPEQITEVLGSPMDFVKAKIDDHIDESAAEFMAMSPLAFVATHDSNGRVDVSPKGDPAGFIHVVASKTALIPERKGNNLADSIRNIVDTGRIGIIFVVPGHRETMRINGTATISKDPALLEQLAVQGKPALLCTIVDVEECFFHCGKAMIRSKAWQPDTWGDRTDSLIAQQAAVRMGDTDLAPVISESLEQNYVEELY